MCSRKDVCLLTTYYLVLIEKLIVDGFLKKNPLLDGIFLYTAR